MEDYEILKVLEKNSNNKIVLEFTQKIFKEEFMGLSGWQKKYDKLIDEYGEKFKCD